MHALPIVSHMTTSEVFSDWRSNDARRSVSMTMASIEVTFMHDFSCFDRRLPANRALSIAVDVGVICHASLGEHTATQLFLAHGVPSTVAARVLFHPRARRIPSWSERRITPRGSTTPAPTTRMVGTAGPTAAERDKILVAALQNAFQAMMLTHGSTITMVGASGCLNFQRQMLELTEALILLAGEPDEGDLLSGTAKRMS